MLYPLPFHNFPISIFRYIAYFSFLIQGPSKRVREKYFRIFEISYYLQECFTDNFLSPGNQVRNILRPFDD